MNVEEGLAFILQHFEEGAFPRTISTKSTENRQYVVLDAKDAMRYFEQADFIDCRINAYPVYTQYRGINRQSPNFLMGDLDRIYFKSSDALNNKLRKTLKTIYNLIGGIPTVLSTGNGNHFYQPVTAILLENESLFAEFTNPSTEFIRYAARVFTANKSDPNNHPSVNSCMIRIPGSSNSENGNPVELISPWDGNRPRINPMLKDYYIYLASKKIDENLKRKHRGKKHAIYRIRNSYDNSRTISWVEKLFQDGIDDYRKGAVELIIAPYLIVVKELSYERTYDLIEDWLSKCNNIRKLDFRPSYEIDRAIKKSLKERIPPMSLKKLEEKNLLLYEKLKNNHASIN